MPLIRFARMPILPLPQFEEDLKADAEVYARLKPPTSIVVRFGAMRMVGEFPYDGDAKPGCGSKLVVRTFRGTELGEMLTSTCPNSGCSKSVSRKEMLEYIENSGGRDYPFSTDGRVLRIATVEDLNRQSALDAKKHDHVRFARDVAQRLGLPMKMVDAEETLGGERMVFFFTTLGDDEHLRIDFRPLVMELAARYRTRVDVRQVGARDDARLTADYEKCGQHCCCKQFLKVLKPVSMKNAKIQKATLDPLKISGRCGRLMCCLRYEETTYDELKAKLPKKKVRLITPDGPGFVVDTQILTQLVLVQLDKNGEQGAYPLENLDLTTPPPPAPPPPSFEGDRPFRGGPGGPPPPPRRGPGGPGGPGGSGGGPPRGGPRGNPGKSGGGNDARGGPRDGPRDGNRGGPQGGSRRDDPRRHEPRNPGSQGQGPAQGERRDEPRGQGPAGGLPDGPTRSDTPPSQ